MKAILILSVVLCTALASPFQVCEKDKDKTNGAVKVTAVAVPGCDAAPCIFKKGTNVTISISFTTAKVLTTMTNKVYGEIAGIDVPFPGYPNDQQDVCKLGVACPTKAGGSYIEKVTLPVSTSDPSISLTAKWKIVSGSDLVACIEIPLKIQ